jgi:predicted  nucleic acid-binding Zn-ribbon protein
MLSREEIEQMIDQKIEPLTEEIAALKGQLGKVDLLVVDNRNIRQSLVRLETSQGRLEASQESLKLDLERQEKRFVRFEKQTNDQFTEIKAEIKDLKADTATIKEQLTLTVAMLRRVLPPEEQR